jgi:hypothetical protein
MENEENILRGKNKKEDARKPETQTSNKASNNPVNTEVGAPSAVSVAKISATAAIVTAAIGAISAVTAAYLGYQASRPAPTSTFTPTATSAVISISSPTPFITDIPAPLFTDTPNSSFTPIAMPTFTVLPSSTALPTGIEVIEPSPSPIMFVELLADKTSGKAPLTVKFDARGSYLLMPDGQRNPCRGGACHFTWKIYASGQQEGNSETASGGTFQHVFGTRGNYMVTVDVCWGKERDYCKGSGMPVTVTR